MKAAMFLLSCACLVLLAIPQTLYSAQQQVPDYPNKGLVQAAWDSYNDKKYDDALSFAERCISIYDNNAKKLQASLKGPIPDNKINLYWQLSDVATAKFIKGKILYYKTETKQARQVFSDIIHNYGYAMTYDLRGWYWNVADASKDMLKAMDLGIDFGDSSSSALTTKAWEAFNAKNYKATLGFAEQCIKKYKEAALWQQKALSKYPKKEEIRKLWALNDVATCYFIAGQCYRKLGDREKSRACFSFVRNNLSFGSCWDTHGWYWRITDAGRRVNQRF